MTSKLKCPFCGKKLWYDEQDSIYRCMKSACVMDYEGGTEQLWQALIQAKQDLAKAIDVIDTVRQHKRGTAVIYPNDIAVYCDRAIEQIERKEVK